MRVTTAPKKRLTKHDLKEDRFVTVALEAWDYMVLHKSTVLFVVLGIVAIVSVALLYQQSARGRATRADEILLLAMSDYDAGNFEAAANGISQFLERTPRHPKRAIAGLALGNALLAVGRPGDAKKPFEDVLKSASKGSEEWVASTVGLGYVAESQGNLEAAYAAFDEAARAARSKELAVEATAHAIRAKILLKDLDGAGALLKAAQEEYAGLRGARRLSQLEGELVVARGR